MKFTKTNLKQLKHFCALADNYGCVAVTDWVSGKGRFSKRLALPPFVVEVTKERATKSFNLAGGFGINDIEAARDYFERYPRRNKVLILKKSIEAFARQELRTNYGIELVNFNDVFSKFDDETACAFFQRIAVALK